MMVTWVTFVKADDRGRARRAEFAPCGVPFRSGPRIAKLQLALDRCERARFDSPARYRAGCSAIPPQPPPPALEWCRSFPCRDTWMISNKETGTEKKPWRGGVA